MSIHFDGTAYGVCTVQLFPTGHPWSLLGMGRINAAGMSAINTLYGIGEAGNNRVARLFMNGSSDDKLNFQSNDTGGSETFSSAGAMAQDTWYWTGMIQDNGSARHLALGATTLVADSTPTDLTWSAIDTFAVGVYTGSAIQYMNGDLAEIIALDFAIGQTEWDALIAGTVLPEVLFAGHVIAQWKMVTNAGTLVDSINGYVLTMHNTTQGADHPIARSDVPTFEGPDIDDITIDEGVALTPIDAGALFSDDDTIEFSESPAGTAWPAWLSIDDTTGEITGTAATPGTTTGIKVRATDLSAQTADSNAFDVVVSAVPGVITLPEPFVQLVTEATLAEADLTFWLHEADTGELVLTDDAVTDSDGVIDGGAISHIDIEDGTLYRLDYLFETGEYGVIFITSDS